MIDGIYVPASKTALLSSSNSEQETYLLTLTFEGRALNNYDKVKTVLEEISTICYYDYQGKVHLTKNAICPKQVLKEMYADAIDKLIVLKQQYDPENLLQNNLLNELFDFSAIQAVHY